MPLKTATLIYNPISGREPARREAQIEQARRVLEGNSWKVAVARTSGPGMAGDLARAATEAGTGLIAVCGGDGTINEVVNGLARSPTALAILPGGTANIAARELHLPLDPIRAARELVRSSPHRIALGVARWMAEPNVPAQRYFLSVAGAGFDAYVLHKLSFAFKLSFGVAAYVWEGLRQTVRYSFPLFGCDVDGRRFEGTLGIVHRTSLYAGWLHLAPEASLFEDRLTLCLFKSRSRARYPVYAAAVLARQHARLRDVELIAGRKVVCKPAESGPPIYFELDGELAGALPVTFEVAPDALTLLVPQHG